MAAKDNERDSTSFSQHGGTFADLRGRQSVRATFKLTNVCIEAISILAGQLGIKQKSLFDHLFQDTESLSAIARKLDKVRVQNADRVQKTYVMSRSALISLEDIAKNYNASRDVLIEFSVQRLMPILASEQKRYARRKAVFKQMQQHLEAGRQLLQTAYSELGEEDPLTERLAAVVGGYESAYRQVADMIRKTRDIEAFEPESLERIHAEGTQKAENPV